MPHETGAYAYADSTRRAHRYDDDPEFSLYTRAETDDRAVNLAHKDETAVMQGGAETSSDQSPPEQSVTPRRKRPRPLFLAPQARSGNGHGYLTEAPRQLDAVSVATDPAHVVEAIAAAVSMTDEPECVGPGVADEFGQHARFIERQQHLAEVAGRLESRAGLTVDQRLADAQHRARRRHVDVSGDVHVIRCILDRARLRGRPEPDAALGRLVALEARLDGALDLRAAA